MKNCLVCGDARKEGVYICKMCGMKFSNGIVSNDIPFCSQNCRKFFAVISRESPEMVEREIVI